MALQIWLPLNKENDFKSRGLLNNTFIKASAPTYNSSGKIGGCYSFDGTDDDFHSTADKSFWSGKEISFACWFKSDKTKANGTLIEIGADLCINYYYNSSGIRFGYWRCYNNSGTRAGDSLLTSIYYNADLWHHVVATFDHQYNKIYIDGQLSQEWNLSSLYTTNWVALLGNTYNLIAVGKSYGSSTALIGGLMNDIRIYDHCLSPKEVKEISKGLVIHYPLDDGNITNIAYDCSGYCNNGTITGTLTTSTDTPRYDKCYTFGSNKLISTTASGSHILTMSIWAKDAGSIPGDGLMFKDHLGDMALGILSNILYSGKSGGGGAGSVSISNISYTANTWHHWVMVNRNGTYYVYMDGLQVLSGTSGSWGAGSVNALHIGGRSGSSPWPGKLSDFRAYCTALSADDVKALYQEAAFIDHKGNIGCYLFYEDSAVDSQITKTGLVKSGVILEFPRKNLFNKDEFQLNHKNYGGPTKPFEYTAYSGKCCGTAIIKPNTQYVLTCNTSISTTFNTVYWGIDGNIIASYTSGGLQEFVSGAIRTSPNNAYFVSVSNFGSISDANQQALINSILLEEASEASTYVAYDSQHDAEVGQNKIISNQLIEI